MPLYLKIIVINLCLGWSSFHFSGWVFAEDVVQLSACTPLQRSGGVAKDATLSGQPLDLGELVYSTGLGVTAGSDLVYDVS